MLEENPRAQSVAAPPHADVIPLVQFYSIELAPLSDGHVFVGIGATLCEDEGELSNMEILSRRVDSFDEALRLIAKSVALAPRLKQ
jgi:hypothetical protein